VARRPGLGFALRADVSERDQGILQHQRADPHQDDDVEQADHDIDLAGRLQHPKQRRSDIYADPGDISFATAADLYDALSRLRFNGVEDISFGGVDVTSSLDRGYDHYALETVKVRRGGAWVAVTENDTLLLRPGSTQRLKVRLVSPVSGPRVVVLEVPVPRRAAGLFGTLDVYGGNSGLFSDEGFYGEEPPPDAGGTGEPSVDEVLKSIRTEPHNDQVVADLAFYDEAGNTAKQRMRRTSTGLVVDGARSFMVETNPGQTPGQKGN
jgi:hypothetical protein